MSEPTILHVSCTYVNGQWYASGGGTGRMMISAPTLTEAVAALVVLLAHDGQTDPVEWKLSPLYATKDDEEDIATAEHPADGWGVVSSDDCHE